jgi:hypothetical protein
VSAASREEDDADGPCETPIPDLFEWSSCVFHTNFLPPIAASAPAFADEKRPDMVSAGSFPW